LIDPVAAKPESNVFSKLWNWFLHPMVVIDLLAILPYFITLLLENSSVNLSFFRILRLFRVFRVFKLGKYSSGLRMFVTVLIRSKEALSVMLFFVSLAMVLFGSVVYYCESGVWTVDENYPDGYYQRISFNQVDSERSPFRSIPGAFWWVIVTVTTVGYGDLYPTSPAGKFIGAVTMISGILTLALPITIISSNYATEAAAQQARQNLKELDTENKTRRQKVFGKKSAAARHAELIADAQGQRRRGDPSVLLQVLNRINSEMTWGALVLIEGEARTLLAARNANPTEPYATGEAAVDKFFVQAIALLRTQPCPLTDKQLSTIRTELIAYYTGFVYSSS